MNTTPVCLDSTHPSAQQGPQYALGRWVFGIKTLEWGDCEPVPWGVVCYEQGQIQWVRPYHQLPEGLKAQLAPRLPAAQFTLITPGLINTHTHLEQSPLPEESYPVPKSPGATMADWLLALVKRQRGLDVSPEAQQARCKVGVAQLLSNGVTCVNDISSEGASWPVLQQAGLSGVVSLELIYPFATGEVSAPWQARSNQLKTRFLALQSQQTASLKLGLAPHALYNVQPQLWQAWQQELAPYLIHLHLGECAEESQWLEGQPQNPLNAHLHQLLLGQPFKAQPAGLGFARYLSHHGLLAGVNRLVVAHGSVLLPQDWQTLAQALPERLGLAHCPISNTFLHNYSFKQAGLLAHYQIPLALGTDGHLSLPASERPLDLKAQARAAAALHDWTAQQALSHLTWQGAKVLGLGATHGYLGAGAQAAFVGWSIPETAMETASVALSDWLESSSPPQWLVLPGLVKGLE